MKYMKFFLPIIILFLSIGYAATNVTLTITGDLLVQSDIEDFDVYISDIKLNDQQDITLLKSTLEFEYVLKEPVYNAYSFYIYYDVTNASKSFDAIIKTTCTVTDERITINYENLESETILEATSTTTGTLIVAAFGNLFNNSISCTISATPKERNSYGEGEVPTPLEKPDPYYIGREISIGTEKFNIISNNGDTITMFAQYNLGTDYRQTTNENYVSFSVNDGWEYTPGPKEINIQEWSSYPKVYVNEYIDYLKKQTGDNSLSGDLISLSELGKLGCDIPDDYSYNFNYSVSCKSSLYKEWLELSDYFWTRSAISNIQGRIWYVSNQSALGDFSNTFDNEYAYCIRPIITITKETLYKLDTIIAFTIDDVEYKAYEGMTWVEWVNSGFNDGLITRNGVCIGYNGYKIYFDNVSVTDEDEIEENGTYNTSGVCKPPIDRPTLDTTS